jgi:hypothetical protein
MWQRRFTTLYFESNSLHGEHAQENDNWIKNIE